MTNLKFHWSLPIDGEKTQASQATRSGVPDLAAMAEFCKVAEACGIDSLLTPFGFHMPDPIPLVSALAAHTKTIRFLIAYRTGLLSPTLFVQQINTLSQILHGRISLNMIAGTSPAEQASYGDFADHDERYARSREFMQICRDTAGTLANCWLRYADTPAAIKKALDPLPNTTSGGLRLSLIARPSHEEAVAAAYHTVANPDLKWKDFVAGLIQKSDSVAVRATFDMAAKHGNEWLTPTLWTGAVPFRGGPAVAIVGDPVAVAQTFMDFKKAGCSEFILSGWPNLTEMKFFGEHILPVIRNLESK